MDTSRREDGRIHPQWWMPPFLVPIADVAPVESGTGDEALQQVPNPASGGSGRRTHMHYTNSERIEGFASTHALVSPRDKPTILHLDSAITVRASHLCLLLLSIPFLIHTLPC